MTGPKNNLAEVLNKRSAANGSVSVRGDPFSPVPVSASASVTVKRSKFKPATSHALTSSISSSTAPTKPPSTHLPSFSTAGFQSASGLSKGGSASVSRTHLHEKTVTLESTSTPIRKNAVKRTSSDPSVSPDPSPQTLKKFKYNKENYELLLSSEPPVPHYLRFNPAESSEYQSKQIVYDPWADLDRDYPLSPAKSKGKKRDSLLDESEAVLNGFLVDNLNLHRLISNQLIHPEPGNDSTIRHELLALIDSRINAIRKALDTEKPDETPIELEPIRLPAETAGATTASLQQLGEPTRSNEPVRPSSALETISNTQAPLDEDDYWDGFSNFGMDCDFPPDIEEDSMAAGTNTSFSNLTESPFYKEIVQKLRSVFGLQEFRKNQLEAITSAMEGHDVFVLMPTGGGKSLCYQLPAVCSTGKTKGLTVVVTPLVALMQDQVAALLKKGVRALLWNSDTPQEEVNCFLYEHHHDASLLYITPEKLKESNKLRTNLRKIYDKKELARFVVDEAHCISTWGQDFREAYQNLGTLRNEYPCVPVMALTATANRVTIDDIKKQLNIPNCKYYEQSFNRPNLRYIIKEKKKKTIVDDIYEYIRLQHDRDPGVIYCTGRETCERVALKLKQLGLQATHYHAKLPAEEKTAALTDWQNGKVDIIVATIAFGMGIDKADVRFVIHHDLAKSLSGYYQETGRAGRDGNPADCVLYYSFQDFKAICKMIRDPKNRETAISPEAIERQVDDARDVVRYCLNRSDCRRVQLLQFFGEQFDKKLCANHCDNCSDDREIVKEDVTAPARNAVMTVQALNSRSENITLNQLQDILRGASRTNKGHDKLSMYGSAKDIPKELLEQLLRHLLYDRQIFEDFTVVNASGYHTEYIKLSAKGMSFLRSTAKVELDWRPSTRVPRKPKKIASTSVVNDQYTSASSKRKKRTVMEVEDPIELYDDDSITYGGLTYQEVVEMPKGAQDPTTLYRRMKALCDRIIEPNDRDMMDDSTLQYLSALCPRDYVDFKRTLSAALEDTFTNYQQRSQIVESIYSKYGRQLLNICADNNLNKRQNQTITPVIDANWQLQYRASNTDADTLVTQRRKFKPA